MTVALVALLFGAMLIYAGITGRSVTALALGDSQTQAPEHPLKSGQS